MTDQGGAPRGAGLTAIEKEMARQGADAANSFAAMRDQADALAVAIRSTGRLLLLGMGASHAAGRIVEPFYRRLGIDAVAIPLSEQLTAPLPLGDKTVIVTSQSGESAELIRWLEVAGKRDGVYGMTLDPHSTLARAAPSARRERRSGGRFRRYAQPVGYSGAARRDTRGAWRRPHAGIAGASIACRARHPGGPRLSRNGRRGRCIWATAPRPGRSHRAWDHRTVAASRPLRSKGVSSGMAPPKCSGPRLAWSCCAAARPGPRSSPARRGWRWKPNPRS